VTLDQPPDLRRTLALAEPQVHVQHMKGPALEIEIDADSAPRFVRSHR
jgi:hypothetical protein